MLGIKRIEELLSELRCLKLHGIPEDPLRKSKVIRKPNWIFRQRADPIYVDLADGEKVSKAFLNALPTGT